MAWICKHTIGYGGLNQAEMDNNAREIWRVLSSRGFTRNACAGILGNMQMESTINPWAMEKDLDNYGYGLVQWTPRTKLFNWAARNNLNYQDGDTQVKALLYEFESRTGALNDDPAWVQYYPMAEETAQAWYGISSGDVQISRYDYLSSTASPELLAKAFVLNYERPSYDGLKLAERQTAARYYYNLLSGDTPQPTENYTVSVNVSGSGTARVSKTLAKPGELITITATPSSGYRFSSCTTNRQVTWQGELSFFMPSGNVTVTVYFVAEGGGGEKYRVYVEPTTGGTLTPSVSEASAGDTVSVSVSTDPGYQLIRINSDPEVRWLREWDFVMPTAMVGLAGIWEQSITYHRITLRQTEGGQISASAVEAAEGTTITIRAVPEAGYRFVRWVSTPAVSLPSGASGSFRMPASNITLRAEFMKSEYFVMQNDDDLLFYFRDHIDKILVRGLTFYTDGDLTAEVSGDYLYINGKYYPKQLSGWKIKL